MPKDDVVVEPGAVLFEGGGQHTLGGDDEQCEEVVVVGHIPDDDVEKAERLRDDCVQWSCVCVRTAKFGEECLLPHGNIETAKFGELCQVPRGLTAPGDPAEERFGDPDVMTTVQTVRPGINEGEGNISNILMLDQRQILDRSSRPHGPNSRMTDRAQEVRRR